MDNIFVNIILFSLISVNVIKLASLASSSTESTNMAEDVKCGETDKPIQLSESFTLEPIQLIQTHDFDH